MAKKYISKYTGPEIDSGLDNIPKLEEKLTELESEVNASVLDTKVPLSNYSGWEHGTVYVSNEELRYDSTNNVVRLPKGKAITLPKCILKIGNNLKARVIKVTGESGYETIYDYPSQKELVIESGKYVVAIATIDGSDISDIEGTLQSCVLYSDVILNIESSILNIESSINNLNDTIDTIAKNNASLISVNKCIVFDNDNQKIINKDNTAYVSFNSEKAITKPFTEIGYGLISGDNGNLAVVDSENGIEIRQTLINIKTTDRIVALARVKFISEVDTSNNLWTYEIERIIYCNVPYILINGGIVIDSTSLEERKRIQSLPDKVTSLESSIRATESQINISEIGGEVPLSHFAWELGTVYLNQSSDIRYGDAPGMLRLRQGTTITLPACKLILGENIKIRIIKETNGIYNTIYDFPDDSEFLLEAGNYIIALGTIDGSLIEDISFITDKCCFKSTLSSAVFSPRFLLTLGVLTFDNIRKTINLIGDIGIVITDEYGKYSVLKIENIPYGTLYGNNGYGVVAVLDGNIIVSNYDKIPEKSEILTIFRLKFGNKIDDKFEYEVDYVYQSNIPYNVIYNESSKSKKFIPYSGNKLVVQPTLNCKSYGEGIFLSYTEGVAAQGMTIYNGYMFQLYNSGIVRIYDITGDEPIFINQFQLGSYSSTNHANSAQFGKEETDSGFPYLYIGGCYSSKREAYVEKISLSGSELVQTITFSEDIINIPATNLLNCIVGDDGYLWVNNHDSARLYFTKLRLPAISEGDVTLTQNDVIDEWSVEYNNELEVRQDIAVCYGKMFYQYGGTYNRRGVKVYDTASHILLNNIDLTDYVTEEFEGIAIFNNKIWITLLANKGYILEL